MGFQRRCGDVRNRRQTNVTESSGQLNRQTQTTNRRVIVQRDLNTSGDGALINITNYDQLYRPTLSQELETPVPLSSPNSTLGIKVQTRYLYSGNNSYKLVSNPYRAATNSVGASATQLGMGWHVTTYDQNGRTVSAETFDASGLPAPWGGNANNWGTVTTAYNSNATTVTDEAGVTRQTNVDGGGRLSQVMEDPLGLNFNTSYSYDALDNLVGVNQSGQMRSFTYDSLRRLQTATNPESGTTSYTYDANGNLLTKTDALNRVTCFGSYSGSCDNKGYDALNRPVLKTYSDGTPRVNYLYDTAPGGVGRLSSVTANGVSTTNYVGYDSLGRITGSNQITLNQPQAQTYSFSYGYNLAGSLTSETYPSGRTIATAYDSANRTAWMQGTANAATTNYVGNSADSSKWTSYFAHGEPYKIWYGNTLVRTWWDYNAQSQPTAFWDALHDNGNYFLRLEFPMWVDGNNHNNGNLQHTWLFESGPGPEAASPQFAEDFKYDTLNRLQMATDSGGWYRKFGYDQWGNMWTDPGTATGPVLNPNTPTSQQVFSNGNNQRSDQSYDAAGNLQILLSAPNLSLKYDAENRQVSAGGFSYAYDGDGRRVTKTSGGVATIYVYDAMGVLKAEYSTGSPAASKCTTCYLSYDHLGSVRLITDGSANVVSRHDYLPFGEEVPATVSGRDTTFGAGNDFVSQKFTGKEKRSGIPAGLFWRKVFWFGAGTVHQPG